MLSLTVKAPLSSLIVIKNGAKAHRTQSACVVVYIQMFTQTHLSLCEQNSEALCVHVSGTVDSPHARGAGAVGFLSIEHKRGLFSEGALVGICNRLSSVGRVHRRTLHA